MYDYKRKAGLLYHKFVYQKYGKGTRVRGNSDHDIADEESDPSTELTYNQELEHLLYFRTCVVSRDKDVLQIRLKQTISFREKLLKKNETKFPELFPFYFVSPDLVSSPLISTEILFFILKTSFSFIDTV